MAGRIRRHGGNGLDAWPGYVDALSTLLMVIIFVLLVFVLSQAFLTVALNGRSKLLDQAQQQLAEIANALSLERGKEADLQLSVSRLGQQLAARTAERDRLNARATSAEASAASLAEQTRALIALRDSLEKQAQDAAARTMTDAERRAAVELQLSDERKLGASARAQIALLNQQVDELKSQLSAVASALELSKQQAEAKDARIANLAQKLNVALADRVEELQQYRSEFFGKLRTLLANRSGIQVVGDRFVFQSEVLFPVGSADLTPAGIAQMTTLAVTIKDIASEIPPDVHWVLRVDGHTDPQPVKGGSFASNWELSAARAITVVKLLIADGVPPDHLAATGFGEYQPFGPGDGPDAYAKDRRIELRLTDR